LLKSSRDELINMCNLPGKSKRQELEPNSVMKMYFIYSSPYPRISGHTAADRRVRDLLRGLVFAGIDISLATPRSHDFMVDKSHIEDFEILRFGKKLNRHLFWLERISFWVELVYKATAKNVEGIFFYNTKIDSIVPAIFLKLIGKKIFWEICDYHSDFSKNVTARQRMARISELIFSRLSNEIFVISRFLQRYVKSINKKASTTIVPIIVDTDEFINLPFSSEIRRKHRILDDEIIISYVGGMWKHQGVSNLILAFNELVKDGKKIKLLIAGNYIKSQFHDDVKAIVKELDLTNHVILPGWVSTKEVQQILAESDILVVSQLDEDFTNAGLPTKLAEYCAAGKAIIATDVGDITLYLKHEYNAYVCGPSSVSEIEDSISRLIADDKLRQYIGTNAKKLAVEKFCYKKIGIEIARVIR